MLKDSQLEQDLKALIQEFQFNVDGKLKAEGCLNRDYLAGKCSAYEQLLNIKSIVNSTVEEMVVK